MHLEARGELRLARLPACPTTASTGGSAASSGEEPLRCRARHREVVGPHRGSFADEEQNEGYAEYAAMSPEERLEAVGFLHRQHACFFLGLAELPPMRRDVFRVVERERADE